MRTEEWLRNRPVRAEKKIVEAQQRGGLHLGVIFDALQEFSDNNPPTQENARLLASVLGQPHIDELRDLLYEATRALIQESESAVYHAERAIEDWLQEANDSNRSVDRQKITIAQIRKEDTYQSSSLVLIAATLQALVWAVSPPGENKNRICY